MKQLNITFLLTMLMSMIGIQAFAHNIEVANADGVTIYYSYIKNSTELAVTHRGSSYDSYDNEYSGNVVIPETVTYNGKTYSVTFIGEYAFHGCSGLTSATIPNSVTSIGYDAFSDCTGLTTITIPNSVTSIGQFAFINCTGLTTITIPNSVTSIGQFAFYNTAWYNNQPDGLIYAGKMAYCYKGIMPENTSIVLEDGTLGIADGAFSKCKGLTEVTIPNSVTSIDEFAFLLCTGLISVSIPNSVTSIGYGAFCNCTGLTEVTIPNSVTSIGNSAFSDCSGLTSIEVESGNTKYDSRDNCNAIIETSTNILVCGCKNTIIPNSVTSIGISAFDGCSGLTEVTIPNSVTSIDSNAFSYCTGLTSVTIPNSVTSIGGGTFQSCTGLTSVTIPNSVTSIDEFAFLLCTGLTSVSIPNSVTSIGSGAFGGCTGLTSIEVESGNTKYDSRDNCNAIIETSTNTLVCGCKNTIIPNSVTYIRDWAFNGCTGLTEVTIPNSVTSIGSGAFGGCTAVTKIISRATTPPVCGPGALNSINKQNCTLEVPQGTLSAYQAAEQWKEFFFIQESEASTGIGNTVVQPTTGTPTYHTLDGREVKNPGKGIYIVNSKKVMIK